MWFLHVFVVLTVLQWSVVAGEGRTDQLSLSLCRVWEECVRTAIVDNLTPADPGSPQAICEDFVDMLEKHGVDCDEWQESEEGILDMHQNDKETTEDTLPHDEDEAAKGDLDNERSISPYSLNHPANTTNSLGRTNYLRDCTDIHTAFTLTVGQVSSGVHSIKPPNASDPIETYCDQTTDEGGWTVIQRRFDGSLEFFRRFSAYKGKFGDASGEYWLGLDTIHRLTTHNPQELYIELEDWVGNVKYARYSTFSVGPGDDYILSVGGYSGTAGDGFEPEQSDTDRYFSNNGAKFSTRWMDQDTYSEGSIADWHGGGWWFGDGSSYSNLNGPYFTPADGFIWDNGSGVLWKPFNDNAYYSLKRTKMMIRPIDFSARIANRKLRKQ